MSITCCKVLNCKGLGKLQLSNGERYFVLGFCNKHYLRFKRGQDLERNSTRDRRKAIIENDIAKIPLGLNAKDGYIIVDKEYSYLVKYPWGLIGKKGISYARTKINGTSISIHRIITNCPENLYVDHINRNPLDNRLVNLRIVTRKQNNMNTRTRKDCISGYKGVRKRGNLWYVRMVVDGKEVTSGKGVDSPEKAALIYNDMSLKYHGEYGYLNIVKKSDV